MCRVDSFEDESVSCCNNVVGHVRNKDRSGDLQLIHMSSNYCALCVRVCACVAS